MPGPRERGGRLAGDLVLKGAALALALVGLATFLAGAVAGAGFVGRLGGAGWIIYVVVIGSFAMLFGPLVATAFTVFERGSHRARTAVEERREEQRRKFGLRIAEHAPPTHDPHRRSS